MKRIIPLLILVLSFGLCSVSRANYTAHIQYWKGNRRVKLTKVLKAPIKVQAESSVYGGKVGMLLLKGNVVLRLKQYDGRSLRIETKRAIVPARFSEIQVNANGFTIDAGAPSFQFVAALKAHPLASNFRVYWRMSVGSSGGLSWVIYNRKKRTLLFCEWESGEWGNNGSRYLYSDVTDKTIKTLKAQPEGGHDGTFMFGFQNLEKYGAKKRVLWEKFIKRR